jgi:hypothetical protein
MKLSIQHAWVLWEHMMIVLRHRALRLPRIKYYRGDEALLPNRTSRRSWELVWRDLGHMGHPGIKGRVG